MGNMIAASFALLTMISPVYAVVNFDRLTQCTDIQRIWSELRTGDPPFAQRCSQPEGPLQRRIAAQAGHSSLLDLCFLGQPPAAFLSGFQCEYTWSSEVSAGVECFRYAATSDISDYFAHHDDRYAGEVSRYLASASACIGPRGDAAVAPRTLASPVITSLAKYEFGFVATLRSGAESAVALHGYATLDPAVAGNGPGAIEFVSIFIGPLPDSAHPDSVPTQRIGNWSVSIDPADEMREAMERGFRSQAHLRVIVGVRAFGIKRTSGGYEEDPAKLARLTEWEEALAKALMHHDFEPISDEDMRRAHAPTASDIQDRIQNSLPYTYRQNGPVRIASKIVVLMNTWSPSCVKRGGGFGAAVMALRPQPLVKEDNGTVMVIVYGIQSCGTESLRTYLDDVLKDSEDDLKRALEGP